MHFYIVISNVYNESMTAPNFTPFLIMAKNKKKAMNKFIKSGHSTVIEQIVNQILLHGKENKHIESLYKILRTMVDERKEIEKHLDDYCGILEENKKIVREYLRPLPTFYFKEHLYID